MHAPGDADQEFRTIVAMDDAGRATFRIVGELDLVTEPEFQNELDEVLAEGPVELLVDLTSAQFVSVRGYALIGMAGHAVDRVVVRTASALSTNVLAALGFDRVTCYRVPRPLPTHAM